VHQKPRAGWQSEADSLAGAHVCIPSQAWGSLPRSVPIAAGHSEATAGPQTASEVIWYRSYLKYEQMSAMTP